MAWEGGSWNPVPPSGGFGVPPQLRRPCTGTPPSARRAQNFLPGLDGRCRDCTPNQEDPGVPSPDGKGWAQGPSIHQVSRGSHLWLRKTGLQFFLLFPSTPSKWPGVSCPAQENGHEDTTSCQEVLGSYIWLRLVDTETSFPTRRTRGLVPSLGGLTQESGTLLGGPSVLSMAEEGRLEDHASHQKGLGSCPHPFQVGLGVLSLARAGVCKDPAPGQAVPGRVPGSSGHR